MPEPYEVYVARSIVSTYIETILYVDTTPEEEHGLCFHVKKATRGGLEHEEKGCSDPKTSPRFVDRELVGTVKRPDMYRFRTICKLLEVPHAHRDRGIPCAIWTHGAVEALLAERILCA
jgi:hypothetical protein